MRRERKVGKRRYKVMPMPYHFEYDRRTWHDLISEENRIEPVFNRNGFYLDRQTRLTWVEVNGEAWLYLSFDAFRFDLLHNDGNNRMNNHIFEAIKTLIDARLADKRLKELYKIEETMRLFQAHHWIALKGAVASRKRLIKFAEERGITLPIRRTPARKV